MHEVADKDKTSSAHALSRVRRWTNQAISTLQTMTNNLQSRSVCPWTYSYNVDPLRQPSSLIQATCKQVIVPGTSAQCEHVYYPVPVKQNVSGTIVDTWYTLKVGCVLANPFSVPPITQDWISACHVVVNLFSPEPEVLSRFVYIIFSRWSTVN